MIKELIEIFKMEENSIDTRKELLEIMGDLKDKWGFNESLTYSHPISISRYWEFTTLRAALKLILLAGQIANKENHPIHLRLNSAKKDCHPVTVTLGDYKEPGSKTHHGMIFPSDIEIARKIEKSLGDFSG